MVSRLAQLCGSIRSDVPLSTLTDHAAKVLILTTDLGVGVQQGAG